MQQMGETRDAMGMAVMALAEDFANNMKHETRPFYIVFAAKPDMYDKRAIRQGIKAYFVKPEAVLGILVWYVDNSNGIFRFMPELSSPPDIPLDPSILSEKAEDALPSVMAQGSKFKVLVS